MNSNQIVFNDYGNQHLLPVVGMTMGCVKQSLRETLNIPYFADAIVNDVIVLVRYIFRANDRLAFRKRFGVKAGDAQPTARHEAQEIIQAYDLARIAAEVKGRNLPKDESLDLMAEMVKRWAVEHFAKPDDSARIVLVHILKRLAKIESQLGIAQIDTPLNAREEDILEALGTTRMTGETLAEAAGYEYDGHFKQILSTLVKRKLLGNKRPYGYFVLEQAKSVPSQD